MFEIIDRPRLIPVAFVYYFAHLLFSYPLTLIAVLPFTAFLSVLGLSGEHPQHIYFSGYKALTCLFIGPFVGWGFGRLAPSLIPTGRWVWPLPTILFGALTLSEPSHGLVPRLPESFFDTGGDMSGIVTYLLTLPAFSTIGYSIGMAIAGIRPKWSTLVRIASWPFVPTVVLGYLVGFGLLTAIAHEFEDSKIDRWMGVRSLIDVLWLAPDANHLCASPMSSSPLLKRGAYVQGLEIRSCGNDRVLDVGAPRPPGARVIEKVKVLSGPHVGKEGWVLEYGLAETVSP